MEPPPQATAHFRFEGGLNDFIPPSLHGRVLEKHFHNPGSVKDAIESFGVPHTEVETVLINGVSRDFSQLVYEGDAVVALSTPIEDAVPLRPPVNVHAGFILDVHLGRLAAFLRMLGFDTKYSRWAADAELARVSSEESRILLTRDRRLLMRSKVVHGYWLRATDSRLQLEEVSARYKLMLEVSPWTRCMACNERLKPIPKTEVRDRVPPFTFATHEQFSECAACERVYWRGSHYQRMQAWIAQLLGNLQSV